MRLPKFFRRVSRSAAPELKKVQLLDLRQGDVLAVSVPFPMSPAQREALQAHLKSLIGPLGVKALVLEQGITLQVVRLCDQPAPQAPSDEPGQRNQQANDCVGGDVAAVLPQPSQGGIERPA